MEAELELSSDACLVSTIIPVPKTGHLLWKEVKKRREGRLGHVGPDLGSLCRSSSWTQVTWCGLRVLLLLGDPQEAVGLPDLWLGVYGVVEANLGTSQGPGTRWKVSAANCCSDTE